MTKEERFSRLEADFQQDWLNLCEATEPVNRLKCLLWMMNTLYLMRFYHTHDKRKIQTAITAVTRLISQIIKETEVHE